MEEESFENEEIATYLNQHYVAIKVDREVRPDIDDAYMSVVQMLTGSGGWPMTVWLTPARQPFSGGTYFPPREFLALLQQLRQGFDAEPLRVAEQAGEIPRRVQQMAQRPGGEGLPDAAVLQRAFDGFAATFDATNGGFGRAPKFPSPPDLELLLRYHRHAASARALERVPLTLEKMAAGGIHDQVGGGFHRYATDAAWQVPHFEKMLYDNAQLAVSYLEAYQLTKRDDFAAVTRDILDYVGREMTAPDGGFYAATDADSEGVEGKFFVWTPAEIRAALDAPHAEAVLAYYAVTEPGNFHGKNILHVAAPLPEVASKLSIEPARLRQLLDEARSKLYAVRQRRVPPHKDTKILAGWNGLMISAFARAGAVLGNPGYVARARTAARFVHERMRADGRLRRGYSVGERGRGAEPAAARRVHDRRPAPGARGRDPARVRADPPAHTGRGARAPRGARLPPRPSEGDRHRAAGGSDGGRGAAFDGTESLCAQPRPHGRERGRRAGTPAEDHPIGGGQAGAARSDDRVCMRAEGVRAADL